MSSKNWKFGEPFDDFQTYVDGTVVPHRMQKLFLDDVEVGEIEIHMHRRLGKDQKVDVSFGITTVVYNAESAKGGK